MKAEVTGYFISGLHEHSFLQTACNLFCQFQSFKLNFINAALLLADMEESAVEQNKILLFDWLIRGPMK